MPRAAMAGGHGAGIDSWLEPPAGAGSWEPLILGGTAQHPVGAQPGRPPTVSAPPPHSRPLQGGPCPPGHQPAAHPPRHLLAPQNRTWSRGSSCTLCGGETRRDWGPCSLQGCCLGGHPMSSITVSQVGSMLQQSRFCGVIPKLPHLPLPDPRQGFGGGSSSTFSLLRGGRGRSSHAVPPGLAPRSPLHPPGTRPPDCPSPLPPAGSFQLLEPSSPQVLLCPPSRYPRLPLLLPHSPPVDPAWSPRLEPLPRTLTACPSSWRATFILAIPGRLPLSSAPCPGRAGPPPPPQRRLPPPPPWSAPGAAPPPGPGPGLGRDGASPEGWSSGGWYRLGAARGHRAGAAGAGASGGGWSGDTSAQPGRTAPLRSTRPRRQGDRRVRGRSPAPATHGSSTGTCTVASEGGAPAPALGQTPVWAAAPGLQPNTRHGHRHADMYRHWASAPGEAHQHSTGYRHWQRSGNGAQLQQPSPPLTRHMPKQMHTHSLTPLPDTPRHPEVTHRPVPLHSGDTVTHTQVCTAEVTAVVSEVEALAVSTASHPALTPPSSL